MQSQSVSGPGSHILVVDDDAFLRATIRAALEVEGIAVEEAAGGEAGVLAFTTELPSLVLLDVDMPDLDGLSACQRMRTVAGGGEIPIVILTGHTDMATIDSAMEAGASDFLSKPLSISLLRQRVMTLLRAAETSRELRSTFGELRRSARNLEHSTALARVGLWEWDEGMDGVALSAHAIELLGASTASPSVADFVARTVHPDDRAQFEKRITKLGETGGHTQFTHRLLRADGAVLEVEHRVEVSTDPSGMTSIWGTFQDITERRRAEEVARRLSYFDALTGVANQHTLEAHLKRSIASSDDKSVALLVLDLDRFHRINDSLGRHAGDDLLREMALRLRRLSEKDEGGSIAVARPGGNEFAIPLADIDDPREAALLARRVLGVIGEPVRVAGHELTMSGTIGIALYPDDAADAEELMQNAGTALKAAKKSGPGNVRFFGESLNRATAERMVLEAQLREALDAGEIRPYFQAKFDGRTGAVVGAEALARWTKRDGTKVPPAEFIPIAEEMGLIGRLGTAILDATCASLREWIDAGLTPVPISVNVSSAESNTDLVESATELVERHGIEARLIEFEITESVSMKEDTRTALTELSARGFTLSLDDFGTGYSCLAYLDQLPFTTLKIDRSFVLKIDEDGGPVVTAIVAMAKALGFKVVAEGAETESQIEFLRAIGCDQFQAFYFALPVPPIEFAKFLREPS